MTFVQNDGVVKLVDAPSGLSVMEAAVFNGVEGIYASCGGDGGCATCHVYVDEAWRDRVGQKSAKEKNTLRFALKTDPSSRLACQIVIEDELDGLTMRMPERQF